MGIHAGVNLTATGGTTAEFGLGDEINVCGAQYKYVQAAGAVAAFQLCHISATNTILESTTTLVGTAARPTELCVPQFAIASGEYAWVPVGPFKLREDGVTKFKVNAALDCATSVRLYTTGTAGVVDDSATTGLVGGLSLTETITTAEAADCVAVTRLVSFCEL